LIEELSGKGLFWTNFFGCEEEVISMEYEDRAIRVFLVIMEQSIARAYGSDAII
jgi:hypothetical protein